MLLTERETPEGVLVSVCDQSVVGETFENGKVSLTVDHGFYAAKAHEADADEVAASLARASTANIVGEEAVAVAVDRGFVDEANVLEFEGTRHAQYLRL
jgi:hypothetical protein